MVGWAIDPPVFRALDDARRAVGSIFSAPWRGGDRMLRPTAMLKNPAIGALLLSSLVFVACKGADPKQDACEQIVECACSMPNYASVEECRASIDSAISDARMSAEIEGLQFDEGCYDELLGRVVSDVECRRLSELNLSQLIGCPFCTPVHGDKAAGTICTVFEYGSDCASGLVCVANNGATGECVSVCEFHAAGEICIVENGDDVTVEGCAEGLRCDTTTRTCVALLANGGLCTADGDCESGYCDSSGACTPPRGQGQECDLGRCDAGLVCEGNTCVVAPAAGQACPAFVCATGSLCEDGTCVLEEPLVCDVEFENMTP